MLGVLTLSAGVLASYEPVACAEPEAGESYTSLYVLGTSPSDRNVKFNGTGGTLFGIPLSPSFSGELPNTSFSNGLGGGIKEGRYFGGAQGIIGLEADIFGLGQSVSAPQTSGNGTTTAGTLHFWNVNAMGNVMLRYPGKWVQPYIGAGIGVSYAQLDDVNIQLGCQQQSVFGDSIDFAFAYQFLGGLRVRLTESFFLFGEYKYFSTNYKWSRLGSYNGSSNWNVSLDYRTQIFAGGLGFAF